MRQDILAFLPLSYQWLYEGLGGPEEGHRDLGLIPPLLVIQS